MFKGTTSSSHYTAPGAALPVYQTKLPPGICTQGRPLCSSLCHHRHPQSSFTPYRHSWDLLGKGQDTLHGCRGWTTTQKPVGTSCPQLTHTACVSPSPHTFPWASCSATIRTMAVDLMHHFCFFNKSEQPVSRDNAFCPLCFAC
jgi:hypothetical protein